MCDTNVDSAKIYCVSWKSRTQSQETAPRESYVLYVSWCLDNTKSFVVVPKREPLSFFWVILLAPHMGLVVLEAQLFILTKWSRKAFPPLVLDLLSLGEENMPAGGWQAEIGLRSVEAWPPDSWSLVCRDQKLWEFLGRDFFHRLQEQISSPWSKWWSFLSSWKVGTNLNSSICKVPAKTLLTAEYHSTENY